MNHTYDSLRDNYNKVGRKNQQKAANIFIIFYLIINLFNSLMTC